VREIVKLEIKYIMIQATFLGKISVLRRCQWFRCMSYFRVETAVLSNIFHSLLVRLMKCGPKIHCSPLEDRG